MDFPLNCDFVVIVAEVKRVQFLVIEEQVPIENAALIVKLDDHTNRVLFEFLLLVLFFGFRFLFVIGPGIRFSCSHLFRLSDRELDRCGLVVALD